MVRQEGSSSPRVRSYVNGSPGRRVEVFGSRRRGWYDTNVPLLPVERNWGLGLPPSLSERYLRGVFHTRPGSVGRSDRVTQTGRETRSVFDSLPQSLGPKSGAKELGEVSRPTPSDSTEHRLPTQNTYEQTSTLYTFTIFPLPYFSRHIFIK